MLSGSKTGNVLPVTSGTSGGLVSKIPPATDHRSQMNGGGRPGSRQTRAGDEQKVAIRRRPAWERFFYYVQTDPPRKILDLTNDAVQPFACTSLPSFVDRGNGIPVLAHCLQNFPMPIVQLIDEYAQSTKKVVVGFLRCASDDLRLANRNWFFKGYSYAALRIDQLFQLLHETDEKLRNLCCMVMDQKRVHMYFDLDCDLKSGAPQLLTDAKKHVRVRRAFEAVLVKKFKEDFHRAPDLSLLHWEDASSAKKFSYHVHIGSEVFGRSVYELGAWVKQSFVPWILHGAETEDPDCLALTIQEFAPTGTSFVCLIDKGVYTKNRMFRLHGNRKPGGTPLKYVPRPGDPGNSIQPSVDELTVRGLVNYFMPDDTSRDLVWDIELPDKKKGKQHIHGSSTSTPLTSNLEWMRKLRMPWFDEMKYDYPEFQKAGVYGKSGQPCYWMKPGAAICKSCTMKFGRKYMHSSNRSVMVLDIERQQVFYDSTDSDCKGMDREYIEIPEELRAEAGLGESLAQTLAVYCEQAGIVPDPWLHSSHSSSTTSPSVHMTDSESSSRTAVENKRKRKRDEKEDLVDIDDEKPSVKSEPMDQTATAASPTVASVPRMDFSFLNRTIRRSSFQILQPLLAKRPRLVEPVATVPKRAMSCPVSSRLPGANKNNAIVLD